jgi:hypothetical protein
VISFMYAKSIMSSIKLVCYRSIQHTFHVNIPVSVLTSVPFNCNKNKIMSQSCVSRLYGHFVYEYVFRQVILNLSEHDFGN